MTGTTASTPPRQDPAIAGAITKTPLRKKLLVSLGMLAVLILAFVIVVAVQPSEFRVTRSITVAAPPEVVFAQINDFRRWEAWSPWAKRDPAAKATFEGPSSGAGATFLWDGNSEVGAGRLTITESRPPQLIRIHQEFFRPMENECDAEFILNGGGDQTTVTWSMAGPTNFLGKAVGLFIDVEGMVGSDFEDGLASIKNIAEQAARQ